MNRSFGYRGLALGVILVTLVLTPNLLLRKNTPRASCGSTTLRYPYQHGYHGLR
jgi:hypothetical protein